MFSVHCSVSGLDREANEEDSMVHVVVVVIVLLVKLFLHLELHHADASPRMDSGPTNNFEHVLVTFPVA